jgi:hypothetical protein
MSGSRAGWLALSRESRSDCKPAGRAGGRFAVSCVAMGLWDVLPDGERKQWTLDPFVTVGPLRFGMSPGEASAALGGIRANPRWHDSYSGTVGGRYREAGVTLYYASGERLCGVSVDALRGPQVLADGVALAGRVPSGLEQWLVERAKSREPYAELLYLPGGEPASLTLGAVICVQRAGDRLLTRPVFLPASAMDDIYHQLPPEAWAIS